MTYSEVFEHFGIPAQESIYRFAPVFRGVLDGREVVVKRTHAAEKMTRWLAHLAALDFPVRTPLTPWTRLGDASWVAYPWIQGREFAGTAADLAAAGSLLGRLHTLPGAHLPEFVWPNPDAASVAEDVEGLAKPLHAHRPEVAEAVMARIGPMLAGFTAAQLPAIRRPGCRRAT